MLPPLTATRLSFLYAAVFAVIGVHMPFWPVWLEARGLLPEQIGVVLAVGVGVRVVGNPLIADVADRLGERRRPIVVLSVAAMLAFALFAVARDFGPILAISLVFFLMWSGVMPLAESLTMLAVREGGFDYGRIRLWGSLAFVVAAIGGGRVLADKSPDAVYVMILAALAVTVCAALFLPDARPPVFIHTRMPVLQVLRRPGFLVFLAATAAIQASHAAYYAFGTLHWQSAGYGDVLIGALWAEGVIAEIALFAFGNRLIRAIGPRGLILLGGLAGAIRWTVTASTTALAPLVVVQLLHAFTFGATHLGAVHFVARAVPPELSATAQSLYSAIVMGLGLGVMLAIVGPLYASTGAGAFLVVAASALLGAALALRLKSSGGTASAEP